jgi:uncharacterized protein (DUF2235 family)
MDQPPPQELKRREGSPNPDSETEYEFKRRLVLCLDGTWNERDSGTNIYHLSNIVLEGKIEPVSAAEPGANPEAEAAKTWVQMVYYDEGVGTGLLDNVTGGAFGIGLSENVREAYDWLVERYREGDEVYIFGFSRGAYTARSLVGMIANCGLLYRGAPLPPEQLWNGYRKMTPYPVPTYPDGTPVPTRNWWQPFGAPKPGPFRPLQFLKKDEFPGAVHYPKYIPEEDRSETERLLCFWSRRIPIHCLAIFDTVRTLGIEFLAIPWLRDRKTEFHKTQLTWLIQYGLHGLAIDEHRANFSHIPWHRKTKLDTATTIQRTKASGQIKQRWFIGAHSNIGGSYDDGTLAQLPLGWFVQECTDLGLVFKPPWGEKPDVSSDAQKIENCVPLWPSHDQNTGKPKNGHIRDSYTELGRGIWRHVLRAKRNYRRIQPPPEFQDEEEVRSLNEELHESVLKLIALDAAEHPIKSYNPPNLYEYRKRRGDAGLIEPPHEYCDTGAAKGWLAGWLAGIGLTGVLLARWAVGWHKHWLYLVLPLVLAGVALLVDYLESSLTHKRAVNRKDAAGEKLEGWLDLLMNLRMIAVGAFAVGVGFALWLIVRSTFYPVPLAEALWFVAFCLMLLHFNASRLWAARPMREAGFGSIVQLQGARTPAEVVALRDAWMRLCLRPSDAAKLGEGHHQPDPHRLLPVHRTIWRDRVGFIPAYAIAFCAGLWVTLSLLQGCLLPKCDLPPIMGLLSRCSWCWVPADFVVLVAVFADYSEDSIHIGYLEKHSEEPRSSTVRLGRFHSITKFVACLVGMAGLVAAIVMLAGIQVCHAWVQICHASPHPEKCPLCRGILQAPASSLTVPALVSILLAGLTIWATLSTLAAMKPEPPIGCREHP